MNRWLWVFISNEVVLYYSSSMKQKCWSHLITDARDLAEKKKPPPDTKEFLEGLQQIYKDAKEAVKQLGTQEDAACMLLPWKD